jgi:tetratricopeptide (TPR) repeat protein
VAAALNVLSRTAMGAGRADDALRYATEAVEVCQAAGYAWNQGLALGRQAYALAALGRLPEAMDASQAGLELTRRSGNEWGVARFQVGSGDVARALGDPGGARGYYLAALPFIRDAMPAPDAAGCLARLGSVETRLGDLAAARDCLAEGLRLALAAGHRATLARCLLALATLALPRRSRRGRDRPPAGRRPGHDQPRRRRLRPGRRVGRTRDDVPAGERPPGPGAALTGAGRRRPPRVRS